MSKIVMYSGITSGVTTNGDQYAFFINETGLPAVKKGSQTIIFGTSGYAFAGSSGSSGQSGTNGLSGTAGVSGTSGQNGAPGDIGTAGANGTSGVSGTAGINGVDGATGSSGSSGAGGTSGLSYGTSGSSGATGSSGSSGASGTNGLTALGAASKAGTVTAYFNTNGWTNIEGGDFSGFSYKQITFSAAFANTNYSIELSSRDTYDAGFLFAIDKATTGFKIYITGLDNSGLLKIDWLAVSHGETGVSGAPGSSGTSGASGSAGSSGLSYGTSGVSGSAGSSGSSGPAGTSGTSAGGGGAINSKNYEICNVDLTSGTTVNGGFEYVGGMFGITSHWGYDSSRNYEFGCTYPINLAVGKTLKDVIFPIEIDAAGSVPYKIVVWKKQPGTFYPGDKITVDEFNITGATGYNVVEYNVDFLNDGSYQSGDLFFISIWKFDSAGNKHRFRSSVNVYQDIGRLGIFNPTTKAFADGYQHSVTTIFNSNWAGGGVPSTYGTGSYGTIYWGGSIPCFWRIA